MTKADLVNEIVEMTGISRPEVLMTVEAMMKVIKKTMAEDKNNVYLRGFGSFVVKERATKTARNISKNTTLIIPAHDVPSFKPSKSFLQYMAGEEVTSED